MRLNRTDLWTLFLSSVVNLAILGPLTAQEWVDFARPDQEPKLLASLEFAEAGENYRIEVRTVAGSSTVLRVLVDGVDKSNDRVTLWPPAPAGLTSYPVAWDTTLPDTQPTAGTVEYTVQAGDTLAKIAKCSGTGELGPMSDAIRALNPDTDFGKLAIGQKVIVPFPTIADTSTYWPVFDTLTRQQSRFGLTDRDGNVIGVVAVSGGSEVSLRRFPSTTRSWLGLSVEPISGALRSQLDLADDAVGVVVVGVTPDSPAAAAGLELHDVVLGLDGEGVQSPEGLAAAVESRRPDQVVTLDIKRRGRAISTTLSLGRRSGASNASYYFWTPSNFSGADYRSVWDLSLRYAGIDAADSSSPNLIYYREPGSTSEWDLAIDGTESRPIEVTQARWDALVESISELRELVERALKRD
ncbi:MAG: PDZ domain-containing protein [Planctomycetota bacterium]